MPNAFDDLTVPAPAPTANAFDDIAPASPEPTWTDLFSGVDEAAQRMTFDQRRAFESVGQVTDDTREAKMASINLAYVGRRLPQMSADALTRDWPAVRQAFAKSALGVDKPDITDAELYGLIGQNEKTKQAHLSDEYAKADAMGKVKIIGSMFLAHLGLNAKEVWDTANTPFVAIPRAPELPNVPGLGMNNPALQAGIYNTLVPLFEGLETPLGAGTVGVGGLLKAGAGTVPLAKQALVSMSGLFTGLMAKSTVEAAAAAPAVLSDPEASLQQKIEAVGAPVTSAAMTVLGGMVTAMEAAGPAKAKVMTDRLKGRTVGEAARVIRDEAAKATDPKEAAALTAAAERLEALSPEAIKAQEQAALAEQQAKAGIDATGEAKPPTGPDPTKAKESANAAVVGIKNAAVDAELEAMGLPKATHGEKLEFEAARMDAAGKMEADPLAGQKLIQQLADNPRPVTGKENALLLHEVNRLRLERDLADTAFLDAVKAGDPAAIDAARMRVTQAIDDFKKAADVDTLVGTENAQGLALRQMMMKEDYSLASLERQMMVANDGKPLTPEQTTQVRELHGKIMDAEKKLAARLKATKTRLAKETVELEQKLAKGDITTKPKPEPLHLDMEANRLKAEADMLKLEFKRALERQRYENSPPLSKAWQQTVNLYDTARLLMTTGEFSFIMRQGKTAVLSHPVMTAKALPDTFRAFVEDPAGSHALNLKILDHPDAARARTAKLHLVDEGASLSRQEEILMGNMVGKVPALQKTVGRFNQAATYFLNRMRFDLFQNMRKVGMTAAEEKQLAHFVNVATGRGTLGALEAAAVPLGRLMFSPRFLASRIQLAVGEPLWGGTLATRRAIANEYAKTLVGLSLYYSAIKLAMGDKAQIGDDPRSSDFGKVVIGNTRLDPLAGVAQVVVFGSRTATGQKTTIKGDVRPIRGQDVPFGGDRWSDVAANFARSKLHPVPGAIANLFDGTDLGGNPADLTNQALNLSAPLTYMDIYEALEEQDLPDGVALSLLALLGEGVSTYGKPEKKQANGGYSVPAN